MLLFGAGGHAKVLIEAVKSNNQEVQGIFDDNSLVQPSYTPSAGDISTGSVDLCISAVPCDPCTITANDCMTMYLFDAPIANALRRIMLSEIPTMAIEKIILGVPFYARHKTSRALPSGGFYNITYGKISESDPAKYFNQNNSGDFYYNGAPLLKQKVDYIMGAGGAGVLIWEVTYDRFDEYSLLKVISKEKVSDTVIFRMSIDPLRYYHKLEEGVSNYTLSQLNDSTYFYMDQVEIEIPQNFQESFRKKKDNKINFRGDFKFVNSKRVRLVRFI